ncbi:D-glucuronyl C5-epimerase family protein [Reichenbachiella carrageenanivorans]|uniref:D-glucuronyl C5-epimerase family protein n=1 Tax=Reichenbachiella carrageenanivorans TaxID=2979869 RepID=A0ABY6D357_9BACT|nr:D-glucuronyl C5-epimerase family protein [Reichenbachiella carrageenanivorans]UXX80596.1 D-glucuronyl C5-epimerase family protein [Reichenbachiella carrageenanivorans]
MRNKAATKSYKSLNTVLQYFTLKSTDYWHLQYDLNETWEEYFWDMSEKASLCKLARDSNGITQYIGEDGKLTYSHIELAQYGMASYQMYLKTNNNYWLNESKKHVEKLTSGIVQYKNSNSTILANYPINLYNINKPWPSALALGVTISLLTRLYSLEKDTKYLTQAKKLGENYQIEVNQGGVLRKVENPRISILEEYPSDNISGVLNGHITALWSIYDLGKFDEKYKILFTTLSRELAKHLNIWITNNWSLYDISHLSKKKQNLASIHYHMLHIKQILVLFKVTGIPDYATYAERLIKQKYNARLRLCAFISKVLFRIL